MASDAIALAIRALRSTSNALAVVVVDYEGASVATSGDVQALPEPLRSGLSGRALREAGSLTKLLECLLSRLPQSERFYEVHVLAGTHLLVVAYDDDAEADLPMYARRTRATIEEILRASRS